MQFRSPNQSRFKSGMTILELLIVIGIVLILAGASIQAGTITQRYLRFANEYNAIVQMVQRARSLAINKAESENGDKSFGVEFIKGDSANPQQTVCPFSFGEGANPPAPCASNDTIIINGSFFEFDIKEEGATGSLSNAHIIYEPNGAILLRGNGSDFTDSAALRVIFKEKAPGTRQRSFILNRVSGVPQFE